MSLIGSLNIGKTALAVNQAALQVTGNNIANAGNPNYTRQVARVSTNADQRTGQNLFIGTGINLDAVQRQIDDALQGRIRGSISDSESADVTQQWMGRVEAVMNELGDDDLSTKLSSFFNAWSNLANKPQDVGVRQVVVQNADSLSRWFNDINHNLNDLQLDVNAQLTSQVKDADSLASQIATLNQQIIVAEGNGGAQANGLRDQRDAVIDQLAQMIDIKSVPQANGAVNIYVGSEPLVTDTRSSGISTRDEVVDGKVVTKVIFKDNNGEMNIQGGSLGALTKVRGSIRDTVDQVDSLATNFIYEVNKLHSSGQGLNRLDDITSTNAVDDTTVALSDTDGTGLKFKPTNGSFVVHVREKATGLETSTLVEVDLDGIGADDSLDTLATKLNAVTGISATVAGGKLNIKTDNPAVDFSFSQDSSGTLAALGLNTLFTGQTAMDIGVNADVKADPTLLAAAKNGEPADNQTARAIAGLETQTLAGLNGQSIKDAYQSMVNTIAVASSDAKANAQATSVVKETLQSQREALSGVSLDEEAINLMRQQRAFQAASKLVSVVDDMMQTVLQLV